MTFRRLLKDARSRIPKSATSPTPRHRRIAKHSNVRRRRPSLEHSEEGFLQAPSMHIRQCMKRRAPYPTSFAIALLAVVIPPTLLATGSDPADHSMQQFLQQDDTQHPYRAVRRLEAE